MGSGYKKGMRKRIRLIAEERIVVELKAVGDEERKGRARLGNVWKLGAVFIRLRDWLNTQTVC